LSSVSVRRRGRYRASLRTSLTVACLLLGAPLCMAEGSSVAGPRHAPQSAATASSQERASSQTPQPAAKEEKQKASEAPASSVIQQRTSLNLLGQTDSERGESRRNENVQFNMIDTGALQDLNRRLGPTATIVEEFRADSGYFGSEFGSPPIPPLHAAAAAGTGIHGNIFETHQNSIFSARSFFQVGGVKSAHQNNYGLNLGLPLWNHAFLSLDGSQDKIRGSVNGNVLVPLPEERTPLTDDPELRPIVERFLGAFPAEPPNRTDVAARALNTNSPQRINTDWANGQFDQGFGDHDRLTLRYGVTLQNVQAFQFLTGQNPDTTIRSHSARLTWSRIWSPATVADFSAGFDRLGATLVAAKGAVGPVDTGFALTELGPNPNIPIDRVQNWFRYGATARHTRGAHQITAGFAMNRLQYNGEETDGHRGILTFGNDFGRDAITNLRMGTPSVLTQALGTTYRAFRNWDMQLYVGDRWRVGPKLTLSWGVRYQPVTRPHDVSGRSDLRYGSDLNNWAPTFGFAYRPPGGWGTLRGAYSLQYGQIFPVAYGQDRLNAPYSLRVDIPAPDLADPLHGLRFEDLDPHGRSTFIEVSPTLRTPYSHQYNFSWEFEPASQWRVQLGYVGSRSHRLIETSFLNRAQPIDGVPLTSATISERRPDQTLFEHLLIQNASRGYYDAARLGFVLPRWHGLTLNAAYWFSKAIDLGSDYTNTASGSDARLAVAQTEFNSHSDLKALSNFDQRHAFLLQTSYATPRLGVGRSRAQRLLGSWNISTVWVAKQGTPFTVKSGSDAPGYGNVDGEMGDRPNLLDPSVLGRTIGDPDSSQRLLPASAFAFINAPEQMAGTLGRNTFRRGRIANLNAALWRSWAISQEARVVLRAESINFLNTPQFDAPTMSLTSPSFGQINNTLNDGRAFRFTLRLEF
jgi:hypothetical protein